MLAQVSGVLPTSRVQGKASMIHAKGFFIDVKRNNRAKFDVHGQL
jgi:hypothetical protein